MNPERAVARVLPEARAAVECGGIEAGGEEQGVGVGVDGGALGLAAAGPDGDVSHGAAARPVSLALLAEVTWLVHVVVVEVAEFRVHAAAPRARDYLLRLLPRRLLFFLA